MKQCRQSMTGCYTHELSRDGAASPTLHKIKPVNIPELEGSGAHEPLPLAKVLLIVDGCQERENKFSLKVCPLLDKLGPDGFSHSPTDIQNTNRTQCVIIYIKGDIKLGGD